MSTVPAARASFRFMRGDAAHWIALGFGSGLSPVAPGTMGTLWAWAAYLVFQQWFTPPGLGVLLLLALAVGLWACTRTAAHLGQGDPGAIVWDEVVAFWVVLWLLMPASGAMQAAAFVLFRVFDAVKPGPVAWADRRFKAQPGAPVRWRQGWGILFDDLVAAGCTLLVLALWITLWTW